MLYEPDLVVGQLGQQHLEAQVAEAEMIGKRGGASCGELADDPPTVLRPLGTDAPDKAGSLEAVHQPAGRLDRDAQLLGDGAYRARRLGQEVQHEQLTDRQVGVVRQGDRRRELSGDLEHRSITLRRVARRRPSRLWCRRRNRRVEGHRELIMAGHAVTPYDV